MRYLYGMALQHSVGVVEEEGSLWQTVKTLGRLTERLVGGRRIRPVKTLARRK